MTRFKESFIKIITEMANANLHKRHPDLSIREWEVQEVLEAIDLFLLETEKEVKNEVKV